MKFDYSTDLKARNVLAQKRCKVSLNKSSFKFANQRRPKKFQNINHNLKIISHLITLAFQNNKKF